MTFDPHFGRRLAPDARDAAFPMRLRLDPLRDQFFPRGLPIGNRHYFAGPVLNQVATGTCVAHGWTAKVHAAPIMQQMPVTPFDFYRKIVLVDEWGDNDHEATAPEAGLQSGTSVRAGAKGLVSMGYAQTYLWAESAEDVRAWMLAGFGGCVIGVLWRSGMMNVDGSGFVSNQGVNEGGHCVYLNGYNDKAVRNGRVVRAFRGQNSWGREWGQQGRFWLTYEDLDTLIAEGGEACALTEVRVRR